MFDRVTPRTKEHRMDREHFDHLAQEYDHYRTLDEATINYLVVTIPGHDQTICDLGCGTGRYLVALIKAFQAAGVRVNIAHGVDISPGMLKTARLRKDKLNPPVEWILGTSERTGLPAQSISLVTAFNSFHHLPIADTLAEVGRILVPGGFFAIYSRCRDQEAEHIWECWFPGYLDYSQTLTREVLSGLSQYNARFRLILAEDFTFTRKAPLSWICKQTENKHYSTLNRYPRKEFEIAYSVFIKNIKAHCQHLDEITYPSSYSLFLYQRMA